MYLLVLSLISMAAAFEIESKLTPEEILQTNISYGINAYKSRLIKFPDERGYSLKATEAI